MLRCNISQSLPGGHRVRTGLALGTWAATFLCCVCRADDGASSPPSSGQASPATGIYEVFDVAHADYISLLPGYVHPTNLTGAKQHGLLISALYGHPLTERIALEANVSGSIFETGVNGGTDYYQQSLSLDAVYNLTSRRGSAFTPFVVLGVGALHDDFYPDSRDGAGYSLSAGVGFVTAPLFNKGIRLRAEGRYVRDSKEGGINEPRVAVGIEIPFGRLERVTP